MLTEWDHSQPHWLDGCAGTGHDAPVQLHSGDPDYLLCVSVSHSLCEWLLVWSDGADTVRAD
jgi:hypothetical protein